MTLPHAGKFRPDSSSRIVSTLMSWRQHHGHATTPAPLEDAVIPKWKPGEGGAASKARAKEMRKYTEQRGMQREAEREHKKKEKEEEKRQHTAVVAEESAAEKPICTFFLQGKCNKGEKCKFRHINTDAPAEEVEAAPVADVNAVLPEDAWLQVLSKLSVAGVCSVARCCVSLATIASTPSLWLELRERTFREVEPVAASVEAGAPSVDKAAAYNAARLECCQSEVALCAYARAAIDPPSELPLAEMTAVAITDKLGVSTHDGRMVRLWEARSGRRLGCRTLKHALTALDAATVGERRNTYDGSGTRAYALVGDSTGGVHALDLDEEIDAPTQRRPFTPHLVEPDGTHAQMCAVLVVNLARGGGGGGSGGGGDGNAGAAGTTAEGTGEEGDEENDEDEADDEAADNERGVGFYAASAYRDGAVYMSTFSALAHVPPQLAWRRTLWLSVEGALTFGNLGGRALVQSWRRNAEGVATEVELTPLVALASGGADSGRIYATYDSMACAIDVERGVWRWGSGRVGGEIAEVDAIHAIEIGDADDGGVAQAAAAMAGLQTGGGTSCELRDGFGRDLPLAPQRLGTRLASFSPGWGLLAVASKRTVTLWDERSKNGPVARFETPGVAGGLAEADGGCVHLDSGRDGWSGALLHLPPGPEARVHIYDIRRLGRAKATAGGRTARGAGAWAGIAAGVPPPLAATVAVARRDRSLGFCFAAGCDGLVVGGGGSKSACSYRWSTVPVREGGRRPAADDEDELAAAEEARQAKAKAKEEAANKKKKRVVTKGGGMKMKQGSSGRTG